MTNGNGNTNDTSNDYYSPDEILYIKHNVAQTLKINRTIQQLEEKIALAKRVRNKYLKALRETTEPREIFMVEMEDGSKYRFQVLKRKGQKIYYTKEVTRGFKGKGKE